MKTIGVIGTGAAGLCTLRHAKLLEGYSIIAWEQQSDVGGLWAHSPNSGHDEFGIKVHSSIYNDMRTNLPKETMRFPDYLFPPSEDSFLPHAEVLKYLKSYSEHNQIREFIKFRHKVESVKPVCSEEGVFSKWEVSEKNLLDGSTSKSFCDYLFVCNGHNSDGFIPDIEDIHLFGGHKIHSRDYRTRSICKNRSVALLGGKISSLDISLEVSSTAKQVYLCHSKSLIVDCKLPENIQVRKGFKKATKDGFILEDDSFIKADAVIFCTGYNYSFPFLDSECGIIVDKNRIIPIYKHMTNSTYPSMMFIGIPSQVIVFPVQDVQARYCLKVVDGSLKLPSKKEMDAYTEHQLNDIPMEGFRPNLHDLKLRGFDYADELIEEANLVPMEKCLRMIYDDALSKAFGDYRTFQKYQYQITGPDSFKVHLKDSV